jgi:hypothetical protein
MQTPNAFLLLALSLEPPTGNTDQQSGRDQETGREERLKSYFWARSNRTYWRSPMKSQDAENRKSSADQRHRTRNPFDVMDVPNPHDREVLEFAASAKLAGTADDENAKPWTAATDRGKYGAIEGDWSSRWNGGADPTIPGDAATKWKQDKPK